MNNFLHNLTSRALNVDNEVRPRLPSLFEPTSSLALFGRDTRLDDEHALIPTVGDEAASTRARSSSTVELRDHADAFESADPFGSRSLRAKSLWSDAMPDPKHVYPGNADDFNVPALPDRLRVPDGSKAPPSSERDTSSLEPDVPSVVDQPPNPKSRRPLSGERSFHDQEAQADDTAGTLSRSTRIQTDLSLNDKRGDRKVVASDEKSLVRSKAVPTPQPPRLSEQRSQFMPSRREIVSKSHAVEKVINVTIGRIEVRAISPPRNPRARSEDRSVPTTSLDDYLRQRGAGGRGGAG